MRRTAYFLIEPTLEATQIFPTAADGFADLLLKSMLTHPDPKSLRLAFDRQMTRTLSGLSVRDPGFLNAQVKAWTARLEGRADAIAKTVCVPAKRSYHGLQ